MIQGHRLRQIRTQRGLSQGALAKLVATDAQYISKLERGVRVSVSTTTLERLVHALHVSADYLLGLPDQMQWTLTSQRQFLHTGEVCRCDVGTAHGTHGERHASRASSGTSRSRTARVLPGSSAVPPLR